MLYLVQHAEAAPEQENPERPLTAQGRTDVSRVARAAARSGVRPTLIGHSDKLRARQTAEILAAELAPAGGLRQMTGLAPKDDPAVAAEQIRKATLPLMLVGHLPHLGRLVSLLLVGDPSKDLVAFRMGGMVCLQQGETGWRLQWVMTPDTCE